MRTNEQVSAGTEFQLNFVKPYSTMIDGKPKPIPYVIDGLLPQGGFSVLAAKPKQGKSSLARFEAVAVAKGMPFLGRDTVQGDVILVSLEDPLHHVDNCLSALQYDPNRDASIHIVEKLPATVEQTVDVLADCLMKMSDIRLIVLDTLPKVLRVSDLNEYMQVLSAIEQLRKLARQFPTLHIQAITHCKKVQTDNPFDSLLGSTSMRGETDTSIVLYEQNRKRIIETETRIGRAIPPTFLEAELVECAGADVIKNYSLAGALSEWKNRQEEKREATKKLSYESRIIEYLTQCDGGSAQQETILQAVDGKRKGLLDAISALRDGAVISVTGIAHSKPNPLTITLNPDRLSMYDFMSQNGVAMG